MKNFIFLLSVILIHHTIRSLLKKIKTSRKKIIRIIKEFMKEKDYKQSISGTNGLISSTGD